jgi:hypothetical protein
MEGERRGVRGGRDGREGEKTGERAGIVCIYKINI